MRRQRYLLVRIDYRAVPAITDYWRDESAGLPADWRPFRSSATLYGKQAAIREAKRLAKVWHGRVFRVVGELDSVCIFDSSAS